MQNNSTIFETLFNRDLSDADNVEFLEKITQAHPYFSPAQFFLLQQTATGTEAFDRQAVKTNILFNNPHWLHYQLQRSTTADRNIFPQVEEHEEIMEITRSGIEKADAPIEKAETVAEELEAPAAIAEAIVEENRYSEHNPGDDADNTAESTEMEAEIEPMRIELKMPPQKTLSTEAMLFEPMHMVDYFASQGIKLTEETQTADKLGKQLKSFTEWLKTMKKVHVENATDLNIKTDDNIQSLAENSNTEAEVLTEAMAEVFAKQGKMGKATEVYGKLSLLNPDKSAYFAAKIENLKGI